MSSEPPTPRIFSRRVRHLLLEFSREAWGHPERFLGKTSFDAGDIEYIDLGNYLTCIERCFPGTNLSLIIVRNEYRLALKALQGDLYTRGAYVTGQPGIGKTFFLVYLLVYLLGQKTAVALQLPNENYVFFTGEGVSVQSTTIDEPLDEYEGKIWGLCDSNHLMTTPSVIFSQFWRSMRVIQATSPKISRWKEWAKQTGASRYIMDIWSIEEIKRLAALSTLTVERMVELARKWGGVPRTILEYYSKSNHAAEADYRGMAVRAIEECRMILRQGAQLDLPDGAPSSFYFIRPQNHPDGRFTPPYVSVPTRTLRCLLAEALQRQTQAIKVEFLKALSTPSETRQAAGYIYESWFHSFFSTPNQSVKCEWISHGDRTQELSSMPNIISATQDMPASWTPPFYWIPPRRSFPGIDSALVLTDRIITFQVTMAKEHKKSAVKQGLLDLCDLLPANLKSLPWSLVFVGTEVNQIQKVAVWWADRISFPTEGESVRVGWTVVDPVREDVVYTQYRDEDEPVAGEPMHTD